MKLKKYSYLILIIVVLFTNVNNILAETLKDQHQHCYYVYGSGNTQKRVRIDIKYEVNINNNGKKSYSYIKPTLITDPVNENEKSITNGKVLNWNAYSGASIGTWFTNISSCADKTIPTHSSTDCDIYLGFYYAKILNENGGPSSWCPAYVAYQNSNEGFYVSDDRTTISKINGYIASKTTATSYFAQEIAMGEIIKGEDGNWECSQLWADDGIFGNPNQEGTVGNLIKKGMQIIRIIVPILIILLGTLDLSKAVFAGKEDGMRKAQQTFIKRIIAGVAVFFVPVLVSIVMSFTDYVWTGEGYKACPFSDVSK